MAAGVAPGRRAGGRAGSGKGFGGNRREGKWRERMGIEPTGAASSTTPNGFEDRAGHQPRSAPMHASRRDGSDRARRAGVRNAKPCEAAVSSSRSSPARVRGSVGRPQRPVKGDASGRARFECCGVVTGDGAGAPSRTRTTNPDRTWPPPSGRPTGRARPSSGDRARSGAAACGRVAALGCFG